MVVEPDPVAQQAHGVLLSLEVMAVDALLLQRPDQSLDHAVLLPAVWRHELLLQSVAAHQPGVGPACEHTRLAPDTARRNG